MMMRHYDLTVPRARGEWKRIRWVLFVFPDISDVSPTEDPEVIRVFHEGERAYPEVWRVELVQAGFDVRPLDSPLRRLPRIAVASDPRIGRAAQQLDEI